MEINNFLECLHWNQVNECGLRFHMLFSVVQVHLQVEQLSATMLEFHEHIVDEQKCHNIQVCSNDCHLLCFVVVGSTIPRVAGRRTPKSVGSFNCNVMDAAKNGNRAGARFQVIRPGFNFASGIKFYTSVLTGDTYGYPVRRDSAIPPAVFPTPTSTLTSAEIEQKSESVSQSASQSASHNGTENGRPKESQQTSQSTTSLSEIPHGQSAVGKANEINTAKKHGKKDGCKAHSESPIGLMRENEAPYWTGMRDHITLRNPSCSSNDQKCLKKCSRMLLNVWQNRLEMLSLGVRVKFGGLVIYFSFCFRC